MSTPTPHEPQDRTAVPPSAAEGGTGTTGPATGQHATDRPYPPSSSPTPPPTSPDPAVGSTATMPAAGQRGADERHLADEGGADARGADQRAADERHLAEERAAADREAQGRHADASTPPDARGDEARREPLPEPPAKPGLGRHLLGILLGLVLTPVALLLTGIGVARLADVVSAEEAATDPLGLTLLIVGVVLLAVVVLLGAWSPTVPITGGVVWGIGLGLAFLFVPAVMQDVLESMSADRVVPGGVEQLADTAMSGTLLVTGTLLLAAGIAAARARRRGRRWAEGVAFAETARREARDTDRRAR